MVGEAEADHPVFVVGGHHPRFAAHRGRLPFQQTGHGVDAVPVVPVVLLMSGEEDRRLLEAVRERLSTYVEGGRGELAAFAADADAAL